MDKPETVSLFDIDLPPPRGRFRMWVRQAIYLAEFHWKPFSLGVAVTVAVGAAATFPFGQYLTTEQGRHDFAAMQAEAIGYAATPLWKAGETAPSRDASTGREFWTIVRRWRCRAATSTVTIFQSLFAAHRPTRRRRSQNSAHT